MLASLLRLALSEPALLAEHLDAYADLAERDWHLWRARLRRRLLLWLLAGFALAAAVLFAGIALMLWGATGGGHWLLWAVPAAPALLALAAARAAACRDEAGASFANLAYQFRADLKMFKESL